MQDFYIQQRTQQQLTSDQIQRLYLTVNMLGPDNIIGDEFILASQESDLLYIIPLVRHLTAQEAERIVEGYMHCVPLCFAQCPHCPQQQFPDAYVPCMDVPN